MESMWNRVKIKLTGALLVEVLVQGGIADSLGGYLIMPYVVSNNMKGQSKTLISSERSRSFISR